jgi:aminoglycoside phosphotransferase (APT) family kinase protein
VQAAGGVDVATVDAERLERWLADVAPGPGRLHVERLGAGHSNLTYAVTRGPQRWVLRRPPAGPLLPTAHDVLREYRVLDLLARSPAPVRVPAVVAACEDPEVLGAPFYLMERVAGVVVRDELPAWLTGPARAELGRDLVAALAEIHAVPPAPFVEAGLGRPGGYLERQVRRWVAQREGIQAAVAATGGRARELPDYDAVRDWLTEECPVEAAPSVVHGDYKLDNVVVRSPDQQVVEKGAPPVAAVLDWEMATVGDPRADLGYLLSFWAEPGEHHPLGALAVSGPGFPARAELVAVWERQSGRSAGDLTWFVTLAVWKLAVLLEASYHRYLSGTTDDPFFARLEDGVPALFRRAREVCGG